MDDINKPNNVIIESNCSTDFFIGFCSISFGERKFLRKINTRFSFKPLKLQNVLNDYIHT